jgi:cupin domain
MSRATPDPRDELLAAAWRSRVDDAHARSDCPRPERLWDAVRLQVPVDERLRLIDHLADCATCVEAWSLANELAAGVTQPQNTETTRSSSAWSGGSRRRMLLVAAPVLLLIGIAFTVIRPRPDELVPTLRPRDQVHGAPSQESRELSAEIAVENIRPVMKEVRAFLDRDDGAPSPREMVLACKAGERTAILQINGSMPDRIDDHADTLYFVLNGDGISTVDGHMLMVTTGETITVPRGISHGFQRDGRPLILVAVSRGERCIEP